MRKFRGQKRYYKNLLENDLDLYFHNLDFHSWFDLWHDHPDWNGYGNISWKHRHKHLKALIRRFNYLKGRLSVRTEEFQVYSMININDSYQDAVFIHTENPNQDNFPIRIEEYTNPLKLPKPLNEFIESLDFDAFHHKWIRDNKPVFNVFLYDRDMGLPIKKNN
jgi:hypothetical protein